MTVAASETTTERLLSVRAEVANLEAAHAGRLRDFEDAVAANREDPAATKDLARISSSLEMARAALRGLERQRAAEERAELAAGVVEAEQLLTRAQAEYEHTIAAYDYAVSEVNRLDREAFRFRTERDNAVVRLGRRRDELAKHPEVAS
jgi:uncharacterized protein YydD (DUF2326 family)